MESTCGPARDVEVIIRPIADLGDDGANGPVAVLDLAVSADIDSDQLRQNLITMTGLTDCFVIEERRRTVEWGASAEWLEILLQVRDSAWDAIIGGAAWSFATAVGRAARAQFATPPAMPDDDEILSNARFRVASHFEGIDAADLKARSITHTTSNDGYGWEIALGAPDGRQFVVRRDAANGASLTVLYPPD